MVASRIFGAVGALGFARRRGAVASPIPAGHRAVLNWASRFAGPHASPQSRHLQADLGAAFCRDGGARALARQYRAGRRAGVLPLGLRDPSGRRDLRLARRARGRGVYPPAPRPARPRHHQHRRHVHQFRRAGAPAAGRDDRHPVLVAADHGGARRLAAARARADLSLVRGGGRIYRHAGDARPAFRCHHARAPPGPPARSAPRSP